MEGRANGSGIHQQFSDGIDRNPADPSEAVWEIRSVSHDPSIRIVGRFADKDVFVATSFAIRERLGGWQSRAWRDIKVLARAIWDNLFRPYPPVVTINVHDVVSGAIDGKY